MCCWKVAWTTIGTLMVTANYQGHGPVFTHCSEQEATKWIHVVQGRLNKSSGNIQTR